MIRVASKLKIKFWLILILLMFGISSVYSQENWKIVFLSNSDTQMGYSAYVMDMNGNNVQKLLSGESTDSIACSKDGKYIATTGSYPDIKITALDNGTSTILNPIETDPLYMDLAWSPDANQIVFAATVNHGVDLFIVGRDGSNLLQLTHTPDLVERELSWSPDGKNIVFSANDETSTGIFVLDIAKKSIKRLTTSLTMDFFPDWSPDGKNIIFSSQQMGHKRLYTINPDGTELSPVTTESEFEDWRPMWSPDGEQIVFNSSRDGSPQIYLMNKDGSGVTQLTHTSNENFRESWVECWVKTLSSETTESK